MVCSSSCAACARVWPSSSSRAQVPLQDLQRHRDQRHQLVEQRLLPRVETAKRRQFDDAQQRVLRQQRRRGDAHGRRAAEARRDAQIVGRKTRRERRLAVLCALTHQPLAQAERGRRGSTPGASP